MAACAALLVGAPAAGADTVGNPGSFNAQFTGGSMKMAGGVVDVPITPAAPLTVSGTIDKDGNVNVPAASMAFPAVAGDYGGIAVSVTATPQDATGSLDPTTGVASLHLRGAFSVDVGGLAQCTLPVDIPLTTGPSGAVTGAAYKPSDGTLTLVNGTFSMLPATCSNPGAEAALAGLLGPGQNAVVLQGKVDPLITAPAANNPPPPVQQPQPQTPRGEDPKPGCVVPKLKGVTLTSARKALKASGCRSGKIKRKTSSKKKGTVIGHSPKTGTQLAAGSKVDLTVSNGPAKKKRKSRR